MRTTGLLQATAVAGTISAGVIPDTRYDAEQDLPDSRPPDGQSEAKAEPDNESFLRPPIESLLSEAKSLFAGITNSGAGPAARCYCIGGVVCCEEAEGPVCSYGTCGF